jgi:hypothetical protein
MIVLAAAALPLGQARAQPILSAPAEVQPQPPPKPNAVPIDEHTARMIGARRFKLGILAFDYGITDWLSVGTDPPAWAIRSVASVLVPNLHVKGRFLKTSVVEISGQVGAYYTNVSRDTASGHVAIVPLTLFVSTQILPRLALHLEGSYNWSRAWGSGDVASTDVYGTAIMRTAQVAAMLELRLTRVIHLIARGQYQYYSTPIVFEGDGMLDPYTQATASLEVQQLANNPAMAIGGVALTWKHVGVIAGAGYGHYFVPGSNLALPYEGIVPEGSIWALF